MSHADLWGRLESAIVNARWVRRNVAVQLAAWPVRMSPQRRGTVLRLVLGDAYHQVRQAVKHCEAAGLTVHPHRLFRLWGIV